MVDTHADWTDDQWLRVCVEEWYGPDHPFMVYLFKEPLTPRRALLRAQVLMIGGLDDRAERIFKSEVAQSAPRALLVRCLVFAMVARGQGNTAMTMQIPLLEGLTDEEARPVQFAIAFGVGTFAILQDAKDFLPKLRGSLEQDLPYSAALALTCSLRRKMDYAREPLRTCLEPRAILVPNPIWAMLKPATDKWLPAEFARRQQLELEACPRMSVQYALALVSCWMGSEANKFGMDRCEEILRHARTPSMVRMCKLIRSNALIQLGEEQASTRREIRQLSAEDYQDSFGFRLFVQP